MQVGMMSILYFTLLATIMSSAEDQSSENVDLFETNNGIQSGGADSVGDEAKSRPKRFLILSYLLGYKLGAKTVAKYSNYRPYYPAVAYHPIIVSQNYYG